MARVEPAMQKMPLVGRLSELDRVVSRLGAPGPAAFVIAGSAGVGKSRLAAEVADAVAGSGYSTEHVVATRAAGAIPFGVFAPFLPELDGTAGDLLGLLRRTSEAVRERVEREQRLLLVVDDAHLLDDGSAALVHQLAQTGSCSLMLSVRSPGPAPDAVTALWKDGLAERIHLDPLGEAEVRDLATGVLGGPVTGAAVRRLWETSGGNPLYVRELLAAAAESGAFVPDGGLWVLRDVLPAPERLVDLLTSRLADLPPETSEVLDLLALGEPLPLSLLEAVAATEAVEDAERAGLVVTVQQAWGFETRLSHPLYGEVRRQHMPRARLRRLCTRLAEALEEAGVGRLDDALRLARWRLDAGLASDPGLLERAARLARQRFDAPLASRLARASLEAGGGVGAGLVLGEAEFQSGRHAEAEQVLAGLVARCATDAERAAVANARSYNLGMLMGDHAAAEAVIDGALGEIAEPAPRFRLLARRAVSSLWTGESAQALAAAEEVLDADESVKAGEREAVNRAVYTKAVVLAFTGRADEAVAVAYAGLELHRRSGDDTQLPESQLMGAIIGHAAAGRLEAACADADRADGACLAAGNTEGAASFALLGGWARIERGLLPAAAAMLREAAAINRELRDPAPLRWCTGGVALAEGMAGDAVAADAALAELDGLPPHWMTAFDADLVERARAWTAVAAGELSAARSRLLRAAEEAAQREHWVTEARLRHDVVRLGEARGPARRLRELADAVGGDLVAAFSCHAAAVTHALGPELAEAAERLEGTGALLLAAEASCEAARAFRDAGLARQATSSARKAEELAGACGAVQTPALAGAGEGERLTAREREVVALAASGASSREIADRLFVSVRTVDSHLLRAYAKLGVTGRKGLTAALGRAGR